MKIKAMKSIAFFLLLICLSSFTSKKKTHEVTFRFKKVDCTMDNRPFCMYLQLKYETSHSELGFYSRREEVTDGFRWDTIYFSANGETFERFRCNGHFHVSLYEDEPFKISFGPSTRKFNPDMSITVEIIVDGRVYASRQLVVSEEWMCDGLRFFGGWPFNHE